MSDDPLEYQEMTEMAYCKELKNSPPSKNSLNGFGRNETACSSLSTASVKLLAATSRI